MENDRPDVSVILVSYNTRSMTLSCLAALRRGLEGVSAEVWLVDNASTDGTGEAVAEACPDVHLIANPTNRGFGAANNQAMARARGRYFLLLNTDAFVEPDAVRRLLAFMAAHPAVAAAGPKLLNDDGSHQPSAHQLDTPWHAWGQYLGLARLLHQTPPGATHTTAPADALHLRGVYLKGACLMVRREMYERIGGFDERFFFYGDEADWEKRMVDAGGTLAFAVDARVTHLVGQSGTSDRLRYTLHYYVARDLYMHKHFGLSGLLAYRVAVMLWCVRKLVRQAWWWVHPARTVDPFATHLHLFLLRTLHRPSHRLTAAVTATLAPNPSPAAPHVAEREVQHQHG